MDNINHLRFFTQNYSNLQGLRAIPLGLLLLILSLWANLQHGPARDLTLPISVTLVCLAIYLLIDRHYNRAYGKVKRAISHAELFIAAISAVLALAAFYIDTRNMIDISLLGLVFAVLFAFTGFWYWRPATTLLYTNIFLAISLVVLCFLPLITNQEWWSVLGFKSLILAFTFLYGVYCIICGIIAHIYLLRSLSSIQEAA